MDVTTPRMLPTRAVAVLLAAVPGLMIAATATPAGGGRAAGERTCRHGPATIVGGPRDDRIQSCDRLPDALPQAHPYPALPPTDQRQSGALHPHNAPGMGLRGRLWLLAGASRRATGLA